MKTTLFIFFQLLFFNAVFAQQNIVQNPSFEDTLDCNNSQHSPNAAYPWYNPTNSTPDYFSTISSCGISPLQNSDFQLARTGVAYCGVFVLDSSTREYISCRLKDTLVAGELYFCSFYVSKCDFCPYAIDRIGMFISQDSVFVNTYNEIDSVPQVESPQNIFLLDTLNWIQIAGSYIAQGGEKFITIGNFRNSANTNYIYTGGWANGAYYYIDDVSVICTSCPLAIESQTLPLISFTNPFSLTLSTAFIIKSKASYNSSVTFNIIDFSGRIVITKTTDENFLFAAIDFSKKIVPGNYIIQMISNNIVYSYHLVVTP